MNRWLSTGVVFTVYGNCEKTKYVTALVLLGTLEVLRVTNSRFVDEGR
jgi:hypothetical protein